MKSKRYLVAFVILIVFFGGKCGKSTTVPDELVGVWKTLALKYAGCFFELAKDSITIGTKEGEVNSYAITNIKRKKVPDGEWILYTIYYVDHGGKKYEFLIYHYQGNNGVIRFKNQLEIVWMQERR